MRVRVRILGVRVLDVTIDRPDPPAPPREYESNHCGDFAFGFGPGAHAPDRFRPGDVEAHPHRR